MEEVVSLARGSSFEAVLNRLILLRTLRGLDDVILCPNENCDYAGWVQPHFTCDLPLECDLCGYTWRSIQLLPLSRRILNFVKLLLEGREDSLSQIWKDVWTKACPGCNTPIEKNGGCPQMQCARCKLHFCWLCMKPLRSHKSNACDLRLILWSGLYGTLGGLLLHKLLWLCGNYYEVIFALSNAMCALVLLMTGVVVVGSCFVLRGTGIVWKTLPLYILFHCGIVFFTDNGAYIWEIETSFLLAFCHLSILLVNLKFLFYP